MSARTEALHLERKATSYARQGLRGAGTLEAVGCALPEPRAKATVGSYVTRSVQPELYGIVCVMAGIKPWSPRVVLEGLRVIRAVNVGEGVTADSLIQALFKAAEIRKLVKWSREELIDQGCRLWAKRHELNARETRSGEIGAPTFEDDTEAEAWAQIWLSQISRLLREYYGIDLPTEYRRRALQAVGS